MIRLYDLRALANATGMTWHAVRQRDQRGTMPPATHHLSIGKVWTGRAIERWIETNRKGTPE